MRSSRARIAKMNLLSYAESLVARPFSMGTEAPPFVGATPATLGDKRQAVALGKGRPPSGDEAPQTRRAAPRDEGGAGAAAFSSRHGGGVVCCVLCFAGFAGIWRCIVFAGVVGVACVVAYGRLWGGE